MAEIILQQNTQNLIAEIKKQFDGEIKIQCGGEKVGFIRHQQVESRLEDGNFIINVTDITAPDYLISHELFHFFLQLNQAPELMLKMTTDDFDIDDKINATAIQLYDTILHATIFRLQEENGFIDDNVRSLFYQGVLATVTAEPKEGSGPDEWGMYRLITLLDALVFFQNEDAEQITEKFLEFYPISANAALKLLEILTANSLRAPFEARRAAVALFKAFDAQLEAWKLPKMYLNTFATLTPVFSERQLKLEVRQLFDIMHSEFKSNVNFASAYIGIQKNDKQNAFVITVPKNADSKEVIIHTYDMTVLELMNTIDMRFLIRPAE
ncbi:MULTISPECIES: hypothetical protein [Dellaglioa]|uniref:IpaB EvcA family protein n=2 Tax=Dellaglioa TaxID=2767880 RepID=A0A0R1HFT1_9LACO|nr:MULTISPECIES: hypothetical protein [Dellaglioa]KRK45196.1 IpaB EvcA family protein [Dellaglioa algida DSM 15638]MCZ2491707.1 IpaB/EvcA family protein [Dellaglioa carnosa]MCZ2493483.1 IpaB/EvcA family protein [Dellaglioa carnosa]MCZ2494784.1 IpaB/EvcA family protein [Dellaglioa carnosa]MDK1718904.1 IpaB/EvcA family protein [Dellaglioa algida]